MPWRKLSWVAENHESFLSRKLPAIRYFYKKINTIFVNELNTNYGTLASSNKILGSHIISVVDLCTSIKKNLNSIQPPFTTGSPQGRPLSLENNYTHTLSCVGR